MTVARCVLVVIGVLGFAVAAPAGDYTWVVNSGDWGTGTNWAPRHGSLGH